MPEVDLTPIAAMVELYREAKTRIKEWEELADKARKAIEARMVEADTGLLDGKPVISWAYVTSTRLDQTLVKGSFPEVFSKCQTVSQSRRFAMVDTTS